MTDYGIRLFSGIVHKNFDEFSDTLGHVHIENKMHVTKKQNR